MSYEVVKDLNAEGFKRLTGVQPDVFEQMVGVLREAERKKKKAGRPSKLSLEDKLLLTLSYWREYRTQFHLAASYGVHESSANRIITQVENVLSKSGALSLPKRREVTGTPWTVVLVDTTETPIERPKKTKTLLQRTGPEAAKPVRCCFKAKTGAVLLKTVRVLPKTVLLQGQDRCRFVQDVALNSLKQTRIHLPERAVIA